MTRSCGRFRSVPQGVLMLAFMVFAVVAEARGVSPYLPLNLSPEIERKIERVLILGDKPVLRRPIAAATVLDALPKACKREPVLCEEVRRYLQTYMGGAGLTHAAVTVAAAHGATVSLPNQHGEHSDSHANLSATAFVQPGSYLLLSAGGVINQDTAAPTGSMISVGTSALQLDLGYRDHWTSPFSDSAMLISTEAATMPSLTLSNYDPLTRLNLQYELSVSQSSRSDHIATAAGYTQGHPRIANLHLEAEPVAGWSVGINRLQQFGGGARGGNNVSDIFKAWVNPAGADNLAEGATVDQEQGNQQGSFVSNFIFPGATPFAVYFEYAGEDTFHLNNLYLGNSSMAAGLHIPALFQRLDFTYEISEWQNAWWAHHVYQDGVTNRGSVIGHWGGDWRNVNDDVGARAQMFKAAFAAAGGEAMIRYRLIDNQHYSAGDYVRGHDLTLSYARRWQTFYVGGELELGRNVLDERFQRLSAFLRFAPTAAARSSINVVSDDVRSERFLDVGVSYMHSMYNPSEPNGAPKQYVTSTSPHFGMGARRQAGDHGDVGVRVEWERIGGRSFLAFRALDYRYRVGNHLALSLFGGVARYDAPTPALGWYMGGGLQWRDLIPRWDLSLDYRQPDGIQRDKLLASDSHTGLPDEFYTMKGAAAYLSYRF